MAAFPNAPSRSRSEAERAQRERPRDEVSGRSDVRSDDTGAPRAVGPVEVPPDAG